MKVLGHGKIYQHIASVCFQEKTTAELRKSFATHVSAASGAGIVKLLESRAAGGLEPDAGSARRLIFCAHPGDTRLPNCERNIYETATTASWKLWRFSFSKQPDYTEYSMSNERLISQIEKLIRRDPARRGLIGADGDGPGRGELARAAHLFARGAKATGVGLITGFFIPAATNHRMYDVGRSEAAVNGCGNAETDGPPGTVVLADILTGIGVSTAIITDVYCESVVRASCSLDFCRPTELFVSPSGPEEAAAWRADVLREPLLRRISHLVAIERVGPGYESAEQYSQQSETAACQQVADSRSEWQPGHCCNMRGESIEAFSAGLHQFIDDAKTESPNLKVVGIGDGGNEIGMGRFPRTELLKRIGGPNADRVPCRISADATVVAGVSNWGAYALAAAIAVQHDRVELLERHTADSQQQLLEKIVSEAGAVDGVTRRNEPTVDGLPFLTQIQPWIAIRERLGLQP